MALTPSTMLELGTKAPEFSLNTADGKPFTLSEQSIDKGLLVIFTCNHCPYVKHIRKKLVEKIHDYQSRGITVVAINSNDFEAHPDDNPEKMLEEAKTFEYTFPYLVDIDQRVAHSYWAACTPDLFLFDGSLSLVYRGQFDAARPGNDIDVTGADLSRAVEALFSGSEIPTEQKPSMGCNIKWKPGNEPEYFVKA